MARLSVLLTREQRHKLDTEAEATGLSRSQVMGRIVDAYLSLPTSERQAWHATIDPRSVRAPTTSPAP